MTDDPTIAQRINEVARAFEAGRGAPLAQHFPKLTQEYRIGDRKLRALMDDMPNAEVKSPADALAVLTLAVEMFGILHQNSTRNTVGEEAAGAMACAVIKLRDGLAEASGLDPNTFALTSPAVRPAA